MAYGQYDDEIMRQMQAQQMGMPQQAGMMPQGQATPQPAPQAQPQQQGLLDRIMGGIKDFTSDQDRMARMAMAFNTMRLTPDQGLHSVMADRLKHSRELKLLEKQSNATIEFLRKKGVPEEQIQAAATNPELLKSLANSILIAERQKPTETYQQLTAEEATAMGLDSTKQWQRAKESGKISQIGGGGTTINAGESAFDKGLGEFRADTITNDANLALPARDTLNTVATLEALAPHVNDSIVPAPLRPLVPEGFNSVFDAYNSSLNGLVSSLRVPGSGAQSDKDVDLLRARGGSIAQSPEAMAVAHTALRAKAQINAELAQLANEYAADGGDYRAYQNKRNEILNRPILSDEQRLAIENLTGTALATPVKGGYKGPAYEALVKQVGKAEADRLMSQ